MGPEEIDFERDLEPEDIELERSLDADVVKMSAKHQLVIPPKVREQQGWKPGDTFTIYERLNGDIVIQRIPTFKELRGIFTGQITVPFERDKEYGE